MHFLSSHSSRQISRDIATHTPALWSSAYIDCARIKVWPLKTFENLKNTISERNHFKGLQVEIRDKPDIGLEPLNYDPNSLFNKILQSTSSLSLVIHSGSFCWWLSHWDERKFSDLCELSLILTTRKRNEDIYFPQERFLHLFFGLRAVPSREVGYLAPLGKSQTPLLPLLPRK